MEKRTLASPVPLRTFSAERRRNTRQWTMSYYHYHNAYELYYLLNGERYYFIEDRGYRVSAGSLVLIDRGAIHCTAALGEEPFERVLVTVSPDWLGESGELLGGGDPFACFRGGSPVIPLPDGEREYAEAQLTLLMREDVDEARRRIALLSLLLLAEQCRAEKPEPTARDATTDKPKTMRQLISDVTGFVNTHAGEELSLSLVAARFFVSPCYLSRSFSRLAGISFTEYVNAVRIKEAMRLLAETSLGISEIGERVGYRSATHFGRVFRLQAGLSPRAYRQRYLPQSGK